MPISEATLRAIDAHERALTGHGAFTRWETRAALIAAIEAEVETARSGNRKWRPPVCLAVACAAKTHNSDDSEVLWSCDLAGCPFSWNMEYRSKP